LSAVALAKAEGLLQRPRLPGRLKLPPRRLDQVAADHPGSAREYGRPGSDAFATSGHSAQ